MENKSFTARVAVGGLVIGGLLFSGCTAQPKSTPATAVVPASSASAVPAEPETPPTVVVSGDVTVAGAPLAPGGEIKVDTEIESRTKASIRVASTTVLLQKGSRLTVGSGGIRLSAGAVRIDDDVDEVVVSAGELVVTPKGTGFAVALGSSGATIVVTDGAADVAGLTEQPLNLIAGETLRVDSAGETASLTVKLPKDEFLAPGGKTSGKGESSLRALRLAGTFLMTLVIKKSDTQEAPPGMKFQRLWTFIPACEEGACDVAIKRPLLPFTCRTADGCGQKPTYNSGSLPYANGSYEGFLLKGKTGCGTESGGTRTTKGAFKVSGASFANGTWVVTGVSGNLDDRASAFGGCTKMHLVTTITGQPSDTAPRR